MLKFTSLVAVLLIASNLYSNEDKTPEISPDTFSQVGAWFIYTKPPSPDNPMTVSLLLDAESGESAYGEKVTLMICCENNTTKMYLNWGNQLGKKARVKIKFDKEKSISRSWILSPDKRNTCYPDSPIWLIKKMMKHTKLVATVTPNKQEPIVATFDIKDLREVIMPLRKTCHW